MQQVADLNIPALNPTDRERVGQRSLMFVVALVGCTVLSALMASWLPLQVSIITVFLFAGPHNWFELRYFLTRLPVRFGKSRPFFLTAFTGLGILTVTYVSIPLAYRLGWSDEAWTTVIAAWNSLLLVWIGILVWLRGKQKRQQDLVLAVSLLCALTAVNWLQPDFFSLAIVYAHPLVALWFLDKHLRRTRPGWLQTYRRGLCLLPVVLGLMIWRLSQTAPLNDDNGLFWRITQHAGAQLLPGVSSHMLVSVHLFLEMLHYGVWIIALTIIAPVSSSTMNPRRFWHLRTIPLVHHPRGFPKLVFALLAGALCLVGILWLGLAINYATARDIYFTVAIAHVLAEAPFLLRTT